AVPVSRELMFILMSWFSLYLPLLIANDTIRSMSFTLSLHDALPISAVFHYRKSGSHRDHALGEAALYPSWSFSTRGRLRSVEKRSEEHTSELQSQSNLVCRLLLEKKKHVMV